MIEQQIHRRSERGAPGFVRQRLRAIVAARPVGSAPADAIIDRALDLYSRGVLKRRDLQPAIARLESRLRQDIPDLVVERAPRPVSPTPNRAALIVCEPRVVDCGGGRIIVTAESHAIVLTPTEVHTIRGILPGWASPHLFERMNERLGYTGSLTGKLLALSRLWPTLLLMRGRQRLNGEGVPPTAIVTPFAGGLLFGAVEKVEGIPSGGMTATVVDKYGLRCRQLHDWYADRGNRLFVETKTFVAACRLSPRQRELHDKLEAFTRQYADVLAEADWRWRIGYGQPDVTVDAVATAFRICALDEGRREAACDALQAVVASDLWFAEVAQNKANQNHKRKRRPGVVRKGR